MTKAGQWQAALKQHADAIRSFADAAAALDEVIWLHPISPGKWSPANIIVTNEDVAKIIDFGLAKFVGRHALTKSGATMGTMAYMAPEQVSGGNVDQRAVVWSLGVVLYEMLTGQLPFQGENEQAVMYAILCKEPQPTTGLLEELASLIRRALEKDVHNHYQHMNEVLEASFALHQSHERHEEGDLID